MRHRFWSWNATAREPACAAEVVEAATRPIGPPVLHRAYWRVKDHGFKWLLTRAWSVVIGRATGRRRVKPIPKVATRAVAEAVLDLQPGDWVEVKPEAEILQSLSVGGRLKGLFFMPEQRAFCGKRFRVHKRLQNLLLEESGVHRKLQHTVLLENVYCDGIRLNCDRSCFLYWRESWLKRVDGPFADTDQPENEASHWHSHDPS